MVWEEEVRELVGPRIYEKVLEAAETGDITLHKLMDIAARLDRQGRVLGALKHTSTRTDFQMGRWAVRAVLSDWYNHELCGNGSHGTAVQQLVTTFRDPNINLLPLASQIEEIAMGSSSADVPNRFNEIEELKCVNQSLAIQLKEKDEALVVMHKKVAVMAVEKAAMLGGDQEEQFLGEGVFGSKMYKKTILSADYTV